MYLTLHADLGSSNIQMCLSLIAAPDTDDHLFVHSLLYITVIPTCCKVAGSVLLPKKIKHIVPC